MKKRFKKAKKDINNLIVKEDAFGMRDEVTPIISLNQRFAFQTDENKILAFQAWLTQQVDNGILFVEDTTEPWMNEFVESAYKRGVTRGFVQVRGAAPPEDASQLFFAGQKAEFLTSAFAAPESVARLQSLYTRTFLSLKGITDTMDTQLSIILAQGLADGLHPNVVAKNMTDAIDKLERTRALKLARTEIVRAHAEGQLDSFERLGVEEVGVLAEWSTAGDDKVCEQCDFLDGAVLTIKEARGLLPRHPDCRCAWVPALKGHKQPGQVWDPVRVRRKLKKSILARKREDITLPEAKEQETWTGADTKITGDGRE
jgi:SPP1 gp7 family putative phage head morphogenesis protein